jgi:hypothetical protein
MGILRYPRFPGTNRYWNKILPEEWDLCGDFCVCGKDQANTEAFEFAE